MVLGIMPGCGESKEVVNLVNYQAPEPVGIKLNPFVIIDPNGEVTLVNHRPDVGNGTPQAMITLLAEELEVNINNVKIIQAQANKEMYGEQWIGGSSSVRVSWLSSRQMGAAARQMLIKSAALRWSVSEMECYASNGSVYHTTTNKSASYGELVAEASKLIPPEEPILKSPQEFKLIGKSLSRIDIPMKTDGSAIFGIDSRIEGMLYASIERSPVFHGKVKSFNAQQVLEIPGVRHVVRTEMRVTNHTREGVAVVADNYWAALQGRKALSVEWDDSEVEEWDSTRIYAQYKQDSELEGVNYQKKGDIHGVMNKANRVITSEYRSPMMSHAPLEPPNVIADVREDSCLILGSIQDPGWVRQEISEMLQMPLEYVEVRPLVIGGGFGRKAHTDFSYEAAYLSNIINCPVMVIWTREDDITQGPFRPGSINVLKACFDNKSKLTGVSHKVITTDFYEDLGYPKSLLLDGILSHAYEFPNLSYDAVDSKVPLPFIWMRSVGSSANGFALECFMDEIANEVKSDPLDIRISFLEKAPRFVKVLEKLAQLTSWRTPSQNDHGKGLAILSLRNSIIGHVAQVSALEGGGINLEKITAVIDCGIMINPDIVRQQVEGAIIMGLSSSFKKEITISHGKVDQQNFDTYPILRISETPEIEVHVMKNNEEPGGVGEVGMPGVAPAVANAIFDLTGYRIRKLPYDLSSSHHTHSN